MKAARKLQRLQQPQSLLEFVRQRFSRLRSGNKPDKPFPSDVPSRGGDLQPLVLVLLAMTWTAGDSELERFEALAGSM